MLGLPNARSERRQWTHRQEEWESKRLKNSISEDNEWLGLEEISLQLQSSTPLFTEISVVFALCGW